MQHIIFNNPNSPFNVVVITPAYNAIGESRTPDEIIESMTAQALELNLSGINNSDGYLIVNSDALPSDHDCDTGCYLFNAWELNGSQVSVNVDKARQLLLDIDPSNRASTIKEIEAALKSLQRE